MVQDIAYEQLSIPAMLSTMYLNLISQQIKNKVHFDILHIKPIEFAQNCTVPCVFIIGKQDKLVLPKRVTQIFEAYKGKQKQILNSSGQHSSEREPHIIKQCQDFIMQELRKNSQNMRRSVDRRERFLNTVSTNFLGSLANAFDERVRANFGKQLGASKPNVYAYGMKYNFDTYVDESRNEERVSSAGAHYEYYDHYEPEIVHGNNAAGNHHSARMPGENQMDISDDDVEKYLKKVNELLKKEKI